jgi:hypothetical protein
LSLNNHALTSQPFNEAICVSCHISRAHSLTVFLFGNQWCLQLTTAAMYNPLLLNYKYVWLEIFFDLNQ